MLEFVMSVCWKSFPLYELRLHRKDSLAEFIGASLIEENWSKFVLNITELEEAEPYSMLVTSVLDFYS